MVLPTTSTGMECSEMLNFLDLDGLDAAERTRLINSLQPDPSNKAVRLYWKVKKPVPDIKATVNNYVTQEPTVNNYVTQEPSINNYVSQEPTVINNVTQEYPASRYEYCPEYTQGLGPLAQNCSYPAIPHTQAHNIAYTQPMPPHTAAHYPYPTAHPTAQLVYYAPNTYPQVSVIPNHRYNVDAACFVPKIATNIPVYNSTNNTHNVPSAEMPNNIATDEQHQKQTASQNETIISNGVVSGNIAHQTVIPNGKVSSNQVSPVILTHESRDMPINQEPRSDSFTNYSKPSQPEVDVSNKQHKINTLNEEASTKIPIEHAKSITNGKFEAQIPNGKAAIPNEKVSKPNGKSSSTDNDTSAEINGEFLSINNEKPISNKMVNGESLPNESDKPAENGTSTIAAPKMCWSNLFKNTTDTNTQAKGVSQTRSLTANINRQNINKQIKSNGDLCPIRHPKRFKTDFDPVAVQLAEYLADHKVETKSVCLQPRGLVNRGNYCYINSILQALLACPQFYHLFKGIRVLNNTNNCRKNISTIQKMCHFVEEFSPFTDHMKNKKPERNNANAKNHISINSGPPFEPSYVYTMLNGKSDSFQVEGRQEDAEEFLSILLNTLDDEMLELISLIQNETQIPQPVEDVDDEWQVKGGKKKTGISKKADSPMTPINKIFNGLLRSRIQRNGDKPTDHVEPFLTLPLNIEKIKTVNEALDALANRNQLEGVTCTKTNKIVEAWQQTTVEQLPEVLVLHLKCFDYKVSGCTKIMKMVEYPIDLRINNKLLSPKVHAKDKDKEYKLFAIVYHDGKEAVKGHYFTDLYHPGYSTWLRYDDAVVSSIKEEHVLKPQGNRVPYLLFYRRCSNNNNNNNRNK